jgi:hypothetical protein
MEVMLMNNKFDFKDLIQFGMFIIALLTFIYLICHYNKNTFPVLCPVQEGVFIFPLVNHPVAIAFYNYIIADYNIIASAKPKKCLIN